MRLEEGALLALYLFILMLVAVRFLWREKGKAIRRFRIGAGTLIMVL